MLSKSAFNALLKVLEEPPPHIVFIFATTEVQKIPLTIISRCQRYDLRRLTFDEILELITTIIQKEQLKFDPEALRLIAFKSEGSARDAVKLLDQASSLNVGEENISAEMINKMLGCVDVKVIISLLKHVVDKDAEKAIELINELYQLSANMENLIESAADFTAYLSKAKILNNYSIPQFFDYKELINNILIETNVARLSILWQIFNKGLNEVKISHNLLLAVEMIIIKAIYSHSIPDPENLVNVLTQPTIKDSSNSPQKIDDKPLVRKEIITDTVKIEPKIVKINDFLEYLHANFEMDIYYLLLNNVELKKFGDEVIEIAVENINNNSKEQIGSLLFAWTGKKWNVIIQKQHEIVTLKEQIINRVESDEDWKILKKHFPSARISDLLLKA
jgi:DNA polymerase-3 subunit gamma/tau